YIPLPSWLQKKHAIINVKNDDQLCFKWAVLSALFPQDKHADRITKYKPYLNTIKDSGSIQYLKDGKLKTREIKVNYPMPVSEKEYKKFEMINYININVFSYECQKVYPVYVSK